MKKSNFRSKKTLAAIFPVLLMLLVGILSVTSVTYAWFTSGDDATMDQIDVGVSAADGVLVSWTGQQGTWKSHLVIGEMPTGVGYEYNKKPNSISPVSTVNQLTAVEGKTDFRPNFFVANLQNNGEITSSAAPDTGNYICFDFYVKLDSNLSLYLKDTSAVDNKPTNGKNINLSTRVGFINQGSTTYSGENNKLGTFRDAENTMVIWEPNHEAHISSANVGGSTQLENGALKYFGIKQESGTSFPIYPTGDTPDALEVVTTYTDNQLTSTDKQPTPVLNLKAGVNKVSVYIWIEGQDVDCLNDVAGTEFSTLIALTKKNPYVQPTQQVNE